MSTFEGRVALVTGGASGIGRATALRLARDGASVAVLDRDGDGARAVAAEIGGPAFEVDVRDGDAVRAAVDATVDALGGLAILVNNAGVGDLRPLHTVDDALVAPARRREPHRHVPRDGRGDSGDARGGRGAIVNNASVSGSRRRADEAAYSAAKAA